MGEAGGCFDGPTCKVGLHGADLSPEIVVYFSVPDIEAAAHLVGELGGMRVRSALKSLGSAASACARIPQVWFSACINPCRCEGVR